MSVRATITLITPRELRTNSIDFLLAYTKADVKPEIFTELPIGFGVEGSHPIERIIRLDKKIYGIKDSGLAQFKKPRKL